MGRKILIGITILLITGLLAGWYFFSHEAKYFGTSAFRAIPENAPIIIRVHRSGNYVAKSLNNPIWNACSRFPGVSNIYQDLVFADSLYKIDPELRKTFFDKDLTIVIGSENDRLGILYLLELSSLGEKRTLSNVVEGFFALKGATVERVKTGGAKLFCYTWTEGQHLHQCCFTFYSGLFIAGAKGTVIQAVNRLETPVNRGNTFFEKANKTATDYIDLNIYLNHNKLQQFGPKVFNKAFLDRLKGAPPLALWSEIDLTQKDNELLFNGFSFTGDSPDNFFGIFLHQKPGVFNFANLFPAETTFFLSYMIDDNRQFFKDYERMLEHQHQLGIYKKSLSETDSLYNIDLQNIVIDNLDGGAALCFTRPVIDQPDMNKFLVLRVGSGNRMEEAIKPLVEISDNRSKRGSPKNTDLYKIDNETFFKIYKTPLTDFGKRVFGDAFSDVVTAYFTFYDNCLIMGASPESLGRFLMANVLQETLGNSQAYREFASGLSDRSNFYVWGVPGQSLPFFKGFCNDNLFQSIDNQISEFNKIESFGWQATVENGMAYNMARLKFNPVAHQVPTSLVWRSLVGSPLIIQPQFVADPTDKALREIVAQDSGYNFMLLSSQGRIIWKIKLKGPIRSQIFQLNCFNDGKFQYFFSTDEAMHMIGHDGNYVKNYPLALRSPATNGVAVFDYDKNRNYRFFIAGKDHKVYLFDKNGKIVPDWAPQKTEHDVARPVQFFRASNKDYIVFADKNRGYILDRKGKQRVAIKGDISFSGNQFTLEQGQGKTTARLVTTDKGGMVFSIGLDGSVRRLSVGKFSPDHFFICEDLDYDTIQDYIFLDGDSLVAFDQNGQQIFHQKLNNHTAFPPRIIIFPDNSRKIGITVSPENKVYLYNSDGSLYEGFPLDGNSPFEIGFSGPGQQTVNLVTGTSDGYLNNYQIK